MHKSAGHDWENVEFDVNGVRLEAMVAGRDDAPLLILLHGFPEFSYGWRRQIAPLAEAGFRVVVPDQRGYNRSGKPAGTRAYRIDELAADVVGLADAMGAQSFDLVGHDWGGVVAWRTAIRHPARVRRLVAINAPHPAAARRYAKQHWRQLLRSWYIGFFQLPGAPERVLAARNYAALKSTLRRSAPPGVFTEGDFAVYCEAWAQPGALTGMLNWYRALRFGTPRGVDMKVRQPTLIIWGEAEQFLELGLAEASRRYCRDAKIAVIGGAGHFVQHDRPEEVTTLISGFLAAPS